MSPIDVDNPLTIFAVAMAYNNMLLKTRLERLFNKFKNSFKIIFLTCPTAEDHTGWLGVPGGDSQAVAAFGCEFLRWEGKRD